MLVDGPGQEDAVGLLSQSDEEVRAYALEHIAEWRKGFAVLGRLSRDGKCTIKDETGRTLTEEEAIGHLRLWQEMTTPDADTKPDTGYLAEQEQLDEASRIQKRVRQEKRDNKPKQQ